MRAISSSSCCLRRLSSSIRACGSASVPKTICRSSSKIVFSRDSVPTNSRSPSPRTHCQRLLDRRGGIEVRLVGALGVVLAQPAGLWARPVVEVGPGLLREAARGPLVQREQFVIQAARQLGRGDGTDVIVNEHLVQETEHQRRVLGAQQPPRRAVGTQPGDLVEAAAARHGTHRRAVQRHSTALFPSSPALDSRVVPLLAARASNTCPIDQPAPAVGGEWLCWAWPSGP